MIETGLGPLEQATNSKEQSRVWTGSRQLEDLEEMALFWIRRAFRCPDPTALFWIHPSFKRPEPVSIMRRSFETNKFLILRFFIGWPTGCLWATYGLPVGYLWPLRPRFCLHPIIFEYIKSRHTSDRFWKCMLNQHTKRQFYKNAKTHDVYHRCFCFIFDQTIRWPKN